MNMIELTPEPDASNPEAVRLQFRLPNNKRIMRRFLQSDSVVMVLDFVNQPGMWCTLQDVSIILDIRARFSPKDLMSLAEKSIQEAKIANESIQCREK